MDSPKFEEKNNLMKELDIQQRWETLVKQAAGCCVSMYKTFSDIIDKLKNSLRNEESFKMTQRLILS